MLRCICVHLERDVVSPRTASEKVGYTLKPHTYIQIDAVFSSHFPPTPALMLREGSQVPDTRPIGRLLAFYGTLQYRE